MNARRVKLALLIALERLFVLTITGMRVRGQARKTDQPGKNPLGRVLQVKSRDVVYEV